MGNKTDNITIINKYLSDEEYNSMLDSIKYILLPYTDDYKGTSSGVIYDVLFHKKPVITKHYENFQFVLEYNVGVLYKKTLAELNCEELLEDKYCEKLQKQIVNYLVDNQKNAERIRQFVNDRNRNENR